jgi:uncharacterized membrane protein
MTEGRLRSAIAFFAVAGLGIASYLTYSRYSGAQLFCATGGCETVQHSRYAVVAGIPVAVLGLVGYLGFLATTLRRGQTAALAGVCVSVVAVLFSTYLLLAQLFLIHAVCQWCVASDVIVSILAALCAVRFVTAGRPQRGVGMSAERFRGRADGRELQAAQTARKARA